MDHSEQKPLPFKTAAELAEISMEVMELMQRHQMNRGDMASLMSTMAEGLNRQIHKHAAQLQKEAKHHKK